jgi:hypothetical protein
VWTYDDDKHACQNCRHCAGVKYRRPAQREQFGRCQHCGLWFDEGHASAAAGLRTEEEWRRLGRDVDRAKTWGYNRWTGNPQAHHVRFLWALGTDGRLHVFDLFPVQLTYDWRERTPACREELCREWQQEYDQSIYKDS